MAERGAASPSRVSFATRGMERLRPAAAQNRAMKPPCRPGSRVLLPVLCACAALSGCGAEVAGAAGTAAQLSATAAAQAQAQQARLVEQLGAAQNAAAARAASAAD